MFGRQKQSHEPVISDRGRGWMDRMSPGSFGAYVFAAVCVLIATILRWGVGLIDPDILLFPTYYPAVLFAALAGGLGPGVFAAILGGVVCWWIFMPPQVGFLPITLGQQMSLGLYLFAALVIVWGVDHYRRLARRLSDEESLRKLSVEELSHRLKNKLATVQAIIRLRAREHPELGNGIIASLDALSATDELIMATQGRGARIGDVLSAELRPYEVARAAMVGPDILLPPKLAMVVALLVHELATNSAKYGALSIAAGKVSVNWRVDDGRVALDWHESDGPIVRAPTSRGFGTRLFSRALEQFSGAVETEFAPTGLVCKMVFTLPEDPPSSVSKGSAQRPGVFAAD